MAFNFSTIAAQKEEDVKVPGFSFAALKTVAPVEPIEPEKVVEPQRRGRITGFVNRLFGPKRKLPPVSFKRETEQAFKSSVDEVVGDIDRIKNTFRDTFNKGNVSGMGAAKEGAKLVFALLDLGVDIGVGAGKTLFTGLTSGVADLFKIDPNQFESVKKGIRGGAEIAPFVAGGSAVARQVAKGTAKTLGKKVFQDVVGNLALDTAISIADDPEQFNKAEAGNVLIGNIIGGGLERVTGGLARRSAIKRAIQEVGKDLKGLRSDGIFRSLQLSDQAKKEMVFNNPYKVNLSDNFAKNADKIETGAQFSSALKNAEDNTIGPTKLPNEFYGAEAVKRYKTFSPEAKAQSGAAKLASDLFTPISDRIEKISPEAFRRMRLFEHDIRIKPIQDINNAIPFLKQINKLNKDERILADIAALNGDDAGLKVILERNKLDSSTVDSIRKILDDLHGAQKKAGIDLGFQEGYFNRKVKNFDALIQHMEGTEAGGIMQKAIRKAELDKGRALLKHEREGIINSQLRGFQSGRITLSKEGFMKSRNIGTITPELATFYESPFGNLSDYIQRSHEAIQIRKLFGKQSKELSGEFGKRNRLETRIAKLKGLKAGDKGFDNKNVRIDDLQNKIDEVDDSISRLVELEENNMENSIGRFINDMVEKGDIRAADELQLRELLNARFNPSATPKAAQLIRGTSYLTLLTSPLNAVTQLGDLGLSAYKNGLFETVGALFGRPKVSLEDLGIHSIGAEFSDLGLMGRAVEKTLKASGFAAIDRLGKTTFVNAAFKRLQKDAKKPTVEFVNGIQRVFGDNSDQVVKDLQAGNITDDVKYLLFNNLLDIQPIALSDMPLKYLTSGSSRIFYSLKSFAIRQMNFARRETFDIISKGVKNRDKKEVVRGVTNLMKLGMSLAVGNGSVDAVRATMSNREFDIDDLKDSTIDTLLRFALLSKYSVDPTKLKRTGIRGVVENLVLPPTQVIDDLTKDILNADKIKGLQDIRSIRNIPIGGKLYHYWFGKGAKDAAKRGESLF